MKTIIITGPSGSGKTYIANKLSRILKNSIVINTDSYYRDNIFIKLLSLFIYDIYDRLISIKSRELSKTINSIYNNESKITFYNYDFKTKKSLMSVKNNTNNNKFLIIEGIFSHRINLNYNSSINLICLEKQVTCFQRRLERDELERGRNRKEINKRFSKSWDLFFKHTTSYINCNRVYEINTSKQLSYSKLIAKIKN